MPLYEYRCVENGHTFEVLQKISEEPPKTCQFCASPVERVIPLTYRMKNAGIYIFDRQTGKDILHDD